MKVGFVLECTAQGPDAQIYPYVVNRLCPGLQIDKPITLGNKAAVMRDGAEKARLLLETSCQYVFIIWDRMPKWGGKGRCADHIATLEDELAKEQVQRERVFLCCIDEMLESWMIADGRAVTSYFNSLTTHDVGVFGDHRQRSEQSNPKDRIKRFNNRYNDFTDDFKIVQHFEEFDRTARWNESFGQFKAWVDAVCPD